MLLVCKREPIASSTSLGTNRSRFAEAIPEMRIRQQVFWMGWVVFDLLANLINKSTQIFVFPVVFIAPHRFQQPPVRHRSA